MCSGRRHENAPPLQEKTRKADVKGLILSRILPGWPHGAADAVHVFILRRDEDELVRTHVHGRR
jgi:hypothetical protein